MEVIKGEIMKQTRLENGNRVYFDDMDVDTVRTHPPPSHPPLQRGGIDFLKFGNKGGDKTFFLEREGLD